MGKFTNYATIELCDKSLVTGRILWHNEKSGACQVTAEIPGHSWLGNFVRYAGNETRREISQTEYKGFIISQRETWAGDIVFTHGRGGLASETLEEEKQKIDNLLSHNLQEYENLSNKWGHNETAQDYKRNGLL